MASLRCLTRTAVPRSTSLWALPASRLAVPSRGLRSLADLDGPLANRTAPETPSATKAGPASTTPAAGKSTKKAAAPPRQSLVLTLSCPDQRGIVHKVTGWLSSRHFDIRDSAQYGDAATKTFFMRVHALGPADRNVSVEQLRKEFKRDVGEEMQMSFGIEDEARKPRTLLMVSKIGREWSQ